jgi:hypothetical protein
VTGGAGATVAVGVAVGAGVASPFGVDGAGLTGLSGVAGRGVAGTGAGVASFGGVTGGVDGGVVEPPTDSSSCWLSPGASQVPFWRSRSAASTAGRKAGVCSSRSGVISRSVRRYSLTVWSHGRIAASLR